MSGRDWESLVHRHLDGVATSEEVAELSERLESDTDTRLFYLRLARIHASLAADDFDEPSARDSETRFFDLMETLDSRDKRRRLHRIVISLAAIAAVVTVVAGVYSLRPRVEPRIATITLIDGVIRWTGVGGQVSDDLESGRQVTGGTLESLAVDSLVAFEFLDGSAVTISGLSVLTISDDGQKELHLREGDLSATVQAQHEGKPLRLLTSAAELEVRGTQFDVTADATQTKITVNEGMVRATRMADREFVDINAAHAAVATIEAREPLVATAVKEPTSVWKANLAQDRREGDWISGAHALRLQIGRAVEAGEITRDEIRRIYGERLANLREDEGYVRAVPMQVDRHVIYLVSADVSRGGSETVVLVAGSRFRIQGTVKKSADVKFGFSAIDRSGVSGARYMKSFAYENVEESFDLVVPIEQFQHDSDDNNVSPFGRVLVNVFCFTTSREAQLAITNVELLAP